MEQLRRRFPHTLVLQFPRPATDASPRSGRRAGPATTTSRSTSCATCAASRRRPPSPTCSRRPSTPAATTPTRTCWSAPSARGRWPMRLHQLEIVGFGPFADPVTIDFDALSDAGLFLLSGPTGAGKSSVLDAVCFALYGDVPGDRAAAKRLRSDHAAADVVPRVVLEATLSGRRFRIDRSPAWGRPKKRGDGTTTEQARVVISERARRPATARCLAPAQHPPRRDRAPRHPARRDDAPQFCQVAMLPQGRFQAFLRARSEERHALLQQVFQTGRFDRTERWLRDRRVELRRRSEAHHGAVADLVSRVSEVGGDDAPDDWPADPTLPALDRRAHRGRGHRIGRAGHRTSRPRPLRRSRRPRRPPPASSWPGSGPPTRPPAAPGPPSRRPPGARGPQASVAKAQRAAAYAPSTSWRSTPAGTCASSSSRAGGRARRSDLLGGVPRRPGDRRAPAQRHPHAHRHRPCPPPPAPGRGTAAPPPPQGRGPHPRAGPAPPDQLHAPGCCTACSCWACRGALIEGRGAAGTFRETWHLHWEPELSVRLVERSAFGTTVEAAAGGLRGPGRTRCGQPGGADPGGRGMPAGRPPGGPGPADGRPGRAGGGPRRRAPADGRARARWPAPGATATSGAPTPWRSTPSLAGMVMRVSAGLRPACTGLGRREAAAWPGGSRRPSRRWRSSAEPAHSGAWHGALSGLLGAARCRAMVRGRACRLLLDAEQLDPDEAGRQLGRGAHAGHAGGRGSGVRRGVPGRQRHRARPRPDAARPAGRLAGPPPGRGFTDTLPLLRRTFATFEPSERRLIGELVRQDGSAGRRAEPATRRARRGAGGRWHWPRWPSCSGGRR